ncbi:hypothetical protein FVR03_06620 [Pontibacter qinzhouensis]|uniref:Aminotransferase class V-fold PLP-dependent enzyme n=1 Tax=Pontibacter qinzhouensis TaxID=2603253 RepID=A0A5C8K822_9BACT|nr:PLP-dependent transferase [Pontibacter qinzhouensis]TXK49236.1 hypothetical protein FVR03_06620 [Pontibacter qinzhouensis]
MHTFNIQFDSKSYFYQKALANQVTTQGTLAVAQNFDLQELNRQFYWNAKGSPIFFADRLAQARYKLFQTLVKKGQNILSLNADSEKWTEFSRYTKRGFEIRQFKPGYATSYTELVDEQTSLIYLATIGDDLSVPDFQKVIRFAHDRGIVVVVDNTAGAEGILFDPITWGADFVLSNLLHWHPDIKLQGHVVVRSSSLVVGQPWAKRSPYSAENKEEGKIIPLPTSSFWRENPNEVDRIKGKLSATLQLAKWLVASPHTAAVVYPGLAAHPDHFNALKFFRNGYGNQLFWEVKGDKPAFSLLQKQFLGEPVPGVKITPVSGKTVFKIEVRESNLKTITDALQRAFTNLDSISAQQRQPEDGQQATDVQLHSPESQEAMASVEAPGI